MREILFRAKIKKDNGNNKKGDWVYGHYCELKDGRNIIPCIYGFGEVDKKTLGQYIGLTDKNGKKIFEGDIVKHYYFDDNLDEYDIGRIFWNGATCMFLRTCKSGDTCPQIWDSCEYEVIGNIHDNPELLKGGDDR